MGKKFFAVLVGGSVKRGKDNIFKSREGKKKRGTKIFRNIVGGTNQGGDFS